MSSTSAKPVVAIVGRPNVGKSTLFNRIVGRRIAIVENVPGVTRDRNYHEVEIEGREVLLVDTGGFEPDSTDRMMQQVRDQARLAIDEAQVVLLVVDGVEGPSGVDLEIAEALRKSGKPIFLVVNKIDSPRREVEGFLPEFHGLGFDHVFAVSAEHARGVAELLDSVMAALPEPLPLEEAMAEEEEGEEDGSIRLAIIGRPNVGKSTLINRLIGEERLITSPEAGTTRDPVDAELEYEGRRFVLTDTAGIRRKRSIAMRMEAFSVLRAFRAVESSDVVAVLLDATEPAVDQDLKILGLAEEQGKPLLVVVNKWDQIEADEAKRQEFLEHLLWRVPFLAYAPKLPVSALTGETVGQVLRQAMRLYDQASNRVPTPPLNRLLTEISGHHALPVVRGVRAKVYYIAQVAVRPPTFVVQTSRPDLVPPDYRRYVSNRIRSMFQLEVPIRLIFKRKASLRPPPKNLGKSKPKPKQEKGRSRARRSR
jgi:GTP-binding protein